MTIVDVVLKYEAFFGYSHPNVGLPTNPVSSYADVGPNTVQHT